MKGVNLTNQVSFRTKATFVLYRLLPTLNNIAAAKWQHFVEMCSALSKTVGNTRAAIHIILDNREVKFYSIILIITQNLSKIASE